MKKALSFILLLLLAIPVQAQTLVPIAQDSVPDAYKARYKDSSLAHLKYVNRFSTGDSPFIWFIWSDTSEHTAKDIATIRVWGYLADGVEINVATGDDRNNLWALQPVEAPVLSGYRAYDFVFTTEGDRQAAFVVVSRSVNRNDGTPNASGTAGIDCVEAIPETMQGVSSIRPQMKSSGTWYNMLGAPVDSNSHLPSGAYIDDRGHKKIVRH
jgi:hypothetical protein